MTQSEGGDAVGLRRAAPLMEMETGGAGVVAGGRRIPRAGIDGGGTIYGGGTSWASMGGDGGEKQRT